MLVGLLSFTFGAISQVPDSLILTTSLEQLTEQTDEDPDYRSISEGLDADRFRKIPLSGITEKRLKRLGFLTDKQVENILDYIGETGQILSVYELRSIEGMDTSTIRRLLPHLSEYDPDAGLPVTPENLLKKGRHDLLFRYGQGLEKKKGYLTNAYAGSMARELFRYDYVFSNRIKAALSGEKDAGEEFFGPTQKLGMDYYAGYVSLMNTGILKNLTVGNFTAGFGQGLVVGTGSRLGSVVGFNAPLRVSQGVRGSSSTYEGGFQRGVAVTTDFGRVAVSAFYSRHKRDATVSEFDSTENETAEISAFQTSGYHRTSAEIAKRNKLTETLYGGNVSYTGNFFRFGVTAMHAEWSASVEPSPKPYNLWYLRGRSLSAAGLDIVLRLRYISLFGEGGTTFNGSRAWVAGIAAEPAQGVTFSVTARSYDPAYLNIFSNAVGQSTRNANERGCLVNLSAKLFSALNLSAYADLFRRPWLAYRVNEPSEGLEAGLLGAYSGCPGITFTGRVLFREYEQNMESADGKVASTGKFSTLSARLQADMQVGHGISLRTQFEIKDGAAGFSGTRAAYLCGQDIRADLFRKKLEISFRYVLFDIPTWDLRIYSYEPDISGSFSVPVYDGSGIRTMFMARGRISRHFSWWIKYGISWYGDRSSLGTGLEEIPGNIQSDLKVQITYGRASSGGSPSP